MQPRDLQPADFARYPPESKALALRELQLLRQLPLSFLPLLLRELIDYDWKFPVERAELEHQFAYLDSKSPADLTSLMKPFSGLRLSPQLERADWINDPLAFSEKLSAHLWATQQMDLFRQASVDYVHGVNVNRPAQSLAAPRISILLIGQGAADTKYQLFRKLRRFGVHFTNVAAGGSMQEGNQSAVSFAAERARRYPLAFGHWYIDGGAAQGSVPGVSVISYASLQAARVALINRMVATMKPGGGGPEKLRSDLAHMRPAELGLSETGDDAILSRFKVALLTQGSGTQMFSTTFVQWAAREILRRAQPLTLVARFAPRQKEAVVRPPTENGLETDPNASLIDADMGAYYTWINQHRLSFAEESRFVVWFERHRQAFAAGPSLWPGQTDDTPVSFEELIHRVA